MTEEEIKNMMQESIDCKREFVGQAENIKKAADEVIKCLKNGGKVLTFGNGGSAADAQHIAAELVGKYKLERRPFPAIALTTDTSMLTAWSNDKSFESVFERQIEALAKEKDVLIGISTSGMSENVIIGLKKGKERGTVNISLTGNDGGEVKPLSDVNINVSSKNTPRIQECHILSYHMTFLFRFMKGIIDNGNVYIAVSPLYRVRKRKDHYVYSDNELKKILDELGSNSNVQRFKGLGEMNPEQLWDTTMNPKTRLLNKVLIEDAVKADETFSKLMGSDVEPRRIFIAERASEAQVDT